jgi:hypothetical protein
VFDKWGAVGVKISLERIEYGERIRVRQIEQENGAEKEVGSCIWFSACFAGGSNEQGLASFSL